MITSYVVDTVCASPGKCRRAIVSRRRREGNFVRRKRSCGAAPCRAFCGARMESLLVSFSTVAIAEMGDRTQLLSLMLAAHYRRPWPILAGVLCATLANHLLAGIIGIQRGRREIPTEPN